MSDTKSTNIPHEESEPVAQVQLPIHFIKSSTFRVVHASGVWFGGDPHANLHLTFYNERSPIPKRLVVILDDQGRVIGEDVSKRESKDGIVREMEVDVVLSLQDAKTFHHSLGENLKAISANLKHESSESK